MVQRESPLRHLFFAKQTRSLLDKHRTVLLVYRMAQSRKAEFLLTMEQNRDTLLLHRQQKGGIV